VRFGNHNNLEDTLSFRPMMVYFPFEKEDIMNPKPNQQYEEGRRCETCGARLSIYNSGKQCQSHGEVGFYRPIGTCCTSNPSTALALTRFNETGRWADADA